jgi:hypothetical protein
MERLVTIDPRRLIREVERYLAAVRGLPSREVRDGLASRARSA